MQRHWDETYSNTAVDQTGWYESDPEPSLSLIERCALPLDAPLIDIGAGASLLIDRLLDRGHSAIAALDISEHALAALRERLGEHAGAVRWLLADITDPATGGQIGEVAIWHDRALLHFCVDPVARDAYLTTLREAVRPGGSVVLAAFAIGGATMCNGLPVHNYDAESLSSLLGPEFELNESLEHTYHQPWGNPRPYVYSRFTRRESKH